MALTIVNFSNGDLGISLHENPQPTAARFFGSAAHHTITVNAAGTEISGTIDARAIEPVVRPSCSIVPRGSRSRSVAVFNEALPSRAPVFASDAMRWATERAPGMAHSGASMRRR